MFKYFFGLLQENDSYQLAVLVPNHDLHRPVIRGQPFATTLVPDRSSLGWQVDSRSVLMIILLNIELTLNEFVVLYVMFFLLLECDGFTILSL